MSSLNQKNTNLAMMGNQLEKVTKRLDESEAEKKAFHAEMNKFKEDMQEGIAKTLPSLSGDSHTSSFKGFQTVSQLGNNPPSLSGESQVSSFEGFKKLNSLIFLRVNHFRVVKVELANFFAS